MEHVLDFSRLDGRPLSCEPYGEGHINLTFLKDYLESDTYYHITRPEHNLERS